MFFIVAIPFPQNNLNQNRNKVALALSLLLAVAPAANHNDVKVITCTYAHNDVILSNVWCKYMSQHLHDDVVIYLTSLSPSCHSADIPKTLGLFFVNINYLISYLPIFLQCAKL